LSHIISSRTAVHRDISRIPLHWISIALISLLCVLFVSCGSIGQVPTTTTVGATAAPSPTTLSDTALFPADKFQVDKFVAGVISITGNLGPATVGGAYNAVLSVSGGSAPYHFSISTGALPLGLSLEPSKGTISGIPSKSGTFVFTVVVTDHRRLDRGNKQLEIVVSPPSPVAPVNVSISPNHGTLASGASLAFTATVQNTSNTAIAWSASSGTVSSSGLFTAPLVTTTRAVTVTATSMADGSAKASATVSVASASTATPLTITTTDVPPAETGVFYNASVIARGGTPPYSWNVSAGSLPQGLTLDSSTALISGSTSQSGTFTFAAMVTDSAAQSAGQTFNLSVTTPAAGNFDGPAELPRVYMQSSMADTPAPGQTIPVNAGDNLQTAINRANCGDTIELQAGATFTGRFTLPAKSCDDNHWIIIRTSAPDSALPPEGTRITPCYAGVSSLPARPSFQCSSTANVMAKLVTNAISQSGPIIFASGANHYRFLGLEITRVVGGGIIYDLSSLQNGALADHIVFDRVWMHGTAQDDTNRGVSLGGSTYLAVVDSFFTDFHCTALTGYCTDAQAIQGGTGSLPMGPYKIVNNFLEAAAEAILFGGGGGALSPADIEVRRNHMFKPPIWQKGYPGFVGAADGNAFIVKNHFELKNAQRVLFEGNILEYSWGGFTQVGYGILLTPKNPNNACPRCQVTDVTIRYSTISHVGGGLQIANAPAISATLTSYAQAGKRYSIHDVVVDDISGTTYNGPGTFAQVSTDQATLLSDVSLNHITAFPSPTYPGSLLFVGDNGPLLMPSFMFTNSIVNAGRYPVWSTGGATNCAAADVPLATFNACFNPYTFTRNAVINAGSSYPPSSWPAGNFFPSTAAAVQFVNYNNGNGGDYHLMPSSPYKNAGLDGKDLGADVDAVNAAIADVY
jgi:hypothetical protein